ncbi:MAG: pyridoxal-phosphate dependent enzyme [Halobacteriaceae archaeon]
MAELVCTHCGRTYDDGPEAPWRCECEHALTFQGRPIPSGPPPDPVSLDTRRGLGLFDDWLPVRPRVTLGEGFTPLLDADTFEASVKLEYVFPTGSFKDRGAALSISRALANGAEVVYEDSSGNAGQAIATYAARAGLAARIYVPADAKPAKREAISRTGADVVPVEGPRAAAAEACIGAVEETGEWYASHAWDPAFYAGTATMAYEIAYQRDWSAPDAIVLPVGHGTLLLGAYEGFATLVEAGWIDAIPRLLVGQAAGTAPLVAARHGQAAASGSNDIADGIQVANPAREREVLEAIEATGGDAIAVDREATTAALDRLHRSGFYTEPTCAVAPAALERFREQGTISEDAEVVMPLTGSGLKG